MNRAVELPATGEIRLLNQVLPVCAAVESHRRDTEDKPRRSRIDPPSPSRAASPVPAGTRSAYHRWRWYSVDMLYSRAVV